MMRRSTILILAVALAVATQASAQSERSRPDPTAAAAAAAFARFKRLAGEWAAQSTRGWTEESSYRVIAGGSAVLATSFDAHPGETMLTLFHMDGERLMLTHYCVSGNQPRLVATDFSDGGSSVTFTFLDATNLPSRDHGHMDKAIYRFVDDHRFTSQWTWYRDGAESWMEEIVSTRAAESTR